MNEKQTTKIQGVLPYYQKVFERAYGGGSRTAAIKAFCLDCVGFQRSDITNCTALACPLWPYRPYQAGETEDAEDGATESGPVSTQDNATAK